MSPFGGIRIPSPTGAPLADMRQILLIALGALTVACATPDGPFTAVGTPAKPLHEARGHCKEKAGTVPSGAETDWRAYERCMADLGWVKQSSPGSAGPGPTGGSQPSY